MDKNLKIRAIYTSKVEASVVAEADVVIARGGTAGCPMKHWRP